MDDAEAGPSEIGRMPIESRHSQSPKKKRMKQSALSVSEKQTVLNIYKMIVDMWPEDEHLRRSNVVKKTAETAGISIGTVYNIIKEKTTGEVKPPPDCSNRHPYKLINLDEIALTGIRRIVHGFFFKNEIPTLDKVLEQINNDDSLPYLSRSSLYKVLTEKLSFKYAKRSRKSALIDKNEIIVWRINYISEIRKHRSMGKKIFYLDETWVNEGHTKSVVWQDTQIKSNKEAHRQGLSTGLRAPTGKGKRLIILHIGSSDGFLEEGELVFKAKKEDGDYHSEMDAYNFEKWFSGLANKIEKGSIIVMDNASYHSRRKDRIPTSNTRKADIQNWLREKNICFDLKEVRAQLLAKVKANKPRFQQYVVDEMATEMGFTVLRLPPYHCELNPIEMIWSQVKGYIATYNKDFKIKTIKQLVPEAFSKITAENWKSSINHVIKEEDNMLKLDSLIENTVENFIINTNVDSESDSE